VSGDTGSAGVGRARRACEPDRVASGSLGCCASRAERGRRAAREGREEGVAQLGRRAGAGERNWAVSAGEERRAGLGQGMVGLGSQVWFSSFLFPISNTTQSKTI